METLTVALCAPNLEIPLAGLDAWMGAVEDRVGAAAAGGARLLVLPELACMQWLSFAPPDLPAERVAPWLADLAAQAKEPLQALAARSGIALLPGSFPVYPTAGATAPTNQAWLFLPDGRQLAQDKLCLTPIEIGMFAPGSEVRVITWEGVRIAIVICLDTEFTGLWSKLGEHDIDLVLIPAKTGMLSGYYRVFACARARAIELQTVVCAVGAVGAPLGHPATDTGVGGAAAFLPCDHQLNLIGIAAAVEPRAPADAGGAFLICPDLPLGATRRLRHGAAEAEVHPASWPADRIKVTEA